MQDQEELFQKRVAELAAQAYRQGRYTFTGFMNPAETDLFLREADKMTAVSYKLWGGNPCCERLMGRFGDPQEMGYEQDFPMACIRISPLQKKFSDDLGHRDFLGALMNLGIKREALGDIFVEDREAHVFCADTLAPYILENLKKVAHTSVCASLVEKYEGQGEREAAECEITVPSQRIDAVVSKLYGLSRAQSLELFKERKVFVNSRGCENNSYELRQDDMVSVRGYGRFLYAGTAVKTKKDRLRITLLKYGK